MSENKKIHLGLGISLFEQGYKLSGDFGNNGMYLNTTIEQVHIALLTEKIFGAEIKKIIDPFLPESITLGIRKTTKDKKSLSSIEFAVHSDTFTLRIIKSNAGILLCLKLSKTIGFSEMPLIGEYFDDSYGISDLELIYSKTEPGYRDGNQAILEQFASDGQGGRQLSEGFNLVLGYHKDGKPQQIFYPQRITKQVPAGYTDPSSEVPEPAKKSLVQINEFSPSVQDNAIHILVSGGLNLSMFNFQLIGLSIHIPFETFKDFTFPDSLGKIKFDIRGLALNYTSPGLSITGAFYKEVAEDREEYNGLITFKMAKLELIAIASYIKTKKYSSLFAFGYLGVPIPLHPAFNILGLGMGFGLNRTFIMPAISEIARFPLITIIKNGGLGADDTIQKIFADLNRYIALQENSYVLIAGIKFDSFKMVETIAIAALTFGYKLSVNLLGLSVFAKPGMYHIELAFSLRADIDEGVFMARGELTSNSFILFSGLKPTGGFAFGMWFKYQPADKTGPEIKAGDFVISIGGYHPDFKVPAHYPNNIPRLGFDFRIGPVNIYGKAYFALTPACIMAGIEGKISCEYKSSLLSAVISISYKADFIISWQPFYYKAAVDVELYVKIRVGVGPFSKRFEVYLSAGLQLWGPELGGIAAFKVLKYEIPVSFGASEKAKPLLDKPGFIKAYLEEAEKNLTHNITQGITRKIKKKDSEIIIVNAKDFVLEINSKIPITGISGISSGGTGEDSVRNDFYPVYEQAEREVFSNTMNLKLSGAATGFESFTATPITQSVPKAIWNKRGSVSDPLSNNNLLTGVCTGIKIEFIKKETAIVPIPVSLYDTACKTYDDAFVGTDATIALCSDNKGIMQELDYLTELNIFPEDEFDKSDLTNGIAVYNYKSVLATYSI